jgi:SNF2 family DNA or RNA helicase
MLEISFKYIQNNHKSLEIRGGILKDSTDIGKTMTALLFLSYQARHFKDHYTNMNNDPNVRFLHQPSLVLCPLSNVLMQWAEVIAKNFKNLNLIIGFREMPPRPKFTLR